MTNIERIPTREELRDPLTYTICRDLKHTGGSNPCLMEVAEVLIQNCPLPHNGFWQLLGSLEASPDPVRFPSVDIFLKGQTHHSLLVLNSEIGSNRLYENLGFRGRHPPAMYWLPTEAFSLCGLPLVCYQTAAKVFLQEIDHRSVCLAKTNKNEVGEVSRSVTSRSIAADAEPAIRIHDTSDVGKVNLSQHPASISYLTFYNNLTPETR